MKAGDAMMQRQAQEAIGARTATRLRPGAGHAPGGAALRPLKALVRLLSSIRLATALILAIALIVLVGTLVDQAPAAVVADHDAYARWLDGARGKYGPWTHLLEQAGLFTVFRSLVFRALLALLALSIVLCTARRWRSIWNTTFHTRVRVNESFLLHTRFQARWQPAATAAEAAELLRSSLAGRRYHVRMDAQEGSVAIFAEKHRWSRFGTVFTHLGLVLILAGAVAGGIWGFSDSRFIVAEGSTRDLQLGTNISVRVDRSTDQYYADGRPKDLSTDLTVFDNGKPVKQGTVLVNSPLRYHGIAFHESFYGQAAVLKVADAAGRVLYDQAVPLSLKSADGLRPVGTFDLPDQGLSVYVTGPIPGAPDGLIPGGQVRLDLYQDFVRAVRPQNISAGVPVEFGGLTFTFEREARFAGLKVVKDPGSTIIWFAGGFMVLGMVMLFYLPPRRLWALCHVRADGACEVILGIPAQRDVSPASEFGKLRDRITRALGAEPEQPLSPGKDVGENDDQSLV